MMIVQTKHPYPGSLEGRALLVYSTGDTTPSPSALQRLVTLRSTDRLTSRIDLSVFRKPSTRSIRFGSPWVTFIPETEKTRQEQRSKLR